MSISLINAPSGHKSLSADFKIRLKSSDKTFKATFEISYKGTDLFRSKLVGMNNYIELDLNHLVKILTNTYKIGDDYTYPLFVKITANDSGSNTFKQNIYFYVHPGSRHLSENNILLPSRNNIYYPDSNIYLGYHADEQGNPTIRFIDWDNDTVMDEAQFLSYDEIDGYDHPDRIGACLINGGSVVSEMYVFDRRTPPPNAKFFVFCNHLGGWETIAFSEISSETISDRKVSLNNSQKSVIDNDSKEVVKMVSPLIPSSQVSRYKSFFSSIRVYEQHYEDLNEIIITEQEIKEDKSKPYQIFEFKYEYKLNPKSIQSDNRVMIVDDYGTALYDNDLTALIYEL
jgi:hypothetical protein